jgi:hypothetical protein
MNLETLLRYFTCFFSLASINVHVNGEKECIDGENCNSEKCKEKGKEEETCEQTVVDPVINPGIGFSIVPKGEKVTEFCMKFAKGSDEFILDPFKKCPGYFDNVKVGSSLDGAINTVPDPQLNTIDSTPYLYAKDLSGASLICGQHESFIGDWSHLNCHELCYDVILIHDGCHSGMSDCKPNDDTGGYYIEVSPTIILQGGAPNHYRAFFKPNFKITDKDGYKPGWHTICAPLGTINPNENLPSNDNGQWYMTRPVDVLSGAAPLSAIPISPNSAWNDLLADITAIELPVDFTANPAERIGYDNICLHEEDCTDHCDPEPLCYWQHEWKCEDLKIEPWYDNFMKMISDGTKTSPTKSPNNEPLTKPPNNEPVMQPAKEPTKFVEKDVETPYENEKPVPILQNMKIDTFTEHTCVCKLLEDCCPDRCKMAEQEFMALILNVASKKLHLKCCVKHCPWKKISVLRVISIVDDLLKKSKRTDYYCSRALELLTGINQDIILCDSE